MLTLNADMIQRPGGFCLPECQIEKIIELPEKDFADFVAHPSVDRDFIAENAELMGQWDDVYHCLLVMGEGGNDGVLVESGGEKHTQHGAYIPHARDFVERELGRVAELLLNDISPDTETGDICIYLEDIEEATGAEVRDDSEIARIIYRILNEHPSVAGVETVGDCLVVTPDTAQEQDLIDRLIGWVGSRYDSRELYNIMHGELGMSQEDTERLGFDLSDFYTDTDLKHQTHKDFFDDEEKMSDFMALSKDEFLKSYAYLTDEEYEATRSRIEPLEGPAPGMELRL